MGAAQSDHRCPRCGQANAPGAPTCAACGAPIVVPGTLSDPQANTVAGAPVPQGERGPAAAGAPVTDRLARIGPEIATIVSKAISQQAAEFSDRLARHSTEFGDRISRRSSIFGQDMAQRSGQFGDEMAQRSGQFADRVAQRSSRFAERVARRSARLDGRLARHSARLDDRLARRDEQRRRMLVMVNRLRDLARPLPPPSYPMPYAPARANPMLPARAIWFLFVGSWLSGLWVLATWVMLCLFVFGQAGTRMLTMIPNVLTLRTADRPPRSILPPAWISPAALSSGTRLIYILCLGWWLSLAWMLTAYALSLTVIGIPVSYRMYSVAPVIAHL